MEDLKQRYESLYKNMVDSKNVKNMMLFGSVMSEMMERAIQRDAAFAQQAIDKLESINWNQYLTKADAEKLCEKILPRYEWSFETWDKALKSLELESERKTEFNKYALWALMNIIYSKHSETISQKFLEFTAEDVSDEQMIQFIHSLAIDLLTNDSGVAFNIKEFFFNQR